MNTRTWINTGCIVRRILLLIGLRAVILPDRSSNISDIIRLGQRADKLYLVVYYNLWNAPDCVAPRKIGELLSFDYVTRHARAFDRKLVGQPGRCRAVRSGRCREYFYVYVFGERAEKRARFV